MEWQVPLSDLDYEVAEEQAVISVLRRRWLTMGATTQEFEQAFAQQIGTKHALAVSNATVALHLACLALGIGPGDEVIAPALTFVASTNAILYTGARVVFADIIGEQDLNIDPEQIKACITPKTRAILVVHYGGYPCQMKTIKEIADQHGLAIIEDAAHAPGASLLGKMLGSWGAAGCFSFFSNKNLATGEGGMLVTNSDEIADRVTLLRSHGMTSLTWDRHQGHAYSYDVVDLGFNYRIDEIRSALGLVQLGKLAKNNHRRREITRYYRQAFQGLGVGLPFQYAPGESAHHIFPILLPENQDRKAFIDHLRSFGVQTSIHYPPVHQFSYYQARFGEVRLPRTEAIARREVTLPLFPGLQSSQIELVVSAVKAALDSC